MLPADVESEASRCLYCYDPPCIRACPAAVDIPEFIARIVSGDLIGSARLIYSRNPFGWTCGRVCPTERLCAGQCVRTQLDRAVSIGALQAFACGEALKRRAVRFRRKQASLSKVAVVGGGPAGLTCAHYLREKGYDVTVFEREKTLGGLMRLGIPDHRLDKTMAADEIALVAEGLRWERVDVAEQQAQQIRVDYDAVFVAPGRWKFRELGIPGQHSSHVLSANQLLRDIAAGRDLKDQFKDQEVAIIGGGSTALDAARSCLKLGARRATVAYRRGRHEMPANSSELHEAVEDGVEFFWLSRPIALTESSEGFILELEKTALGKEDDSGRREAVGLGKRVSLPVDWVLVAVSSLPQADSVEPWPGLGSLGTRSLGGWGIQSEEDPKLFVGGDVVGAGTVVQAVADGRRGAEEIHEWLGGASNGIGQAPS